MCLSGTFGDAWRLFLCRLLRFVFAVALVDLGYGGELRLALIQSVIRPLRAEISPVYTWFTRRDAPILLPLCGGYDHGLHIKMGIKNKLSLTKDELQTYTVLLIYWMSYSKCSRMNVCKNQEVKKQKSTWNKNQVNPNGFLIFFLTWIFCPKWKQWTISSLQRKKSDMRMSK